MFSFLHSRLIQETDQQFLVKTSTQLLPLREESETSFPLGTRFGPGFMGSHRSWVAQGGRS